MKRTTVVLTALVLAGGMTVPRTSFGQSPTQIKSMTWTEVNQLDANSLISQLARLFGMVGPVVKESQLHVQGGSVLINGDDDAVSVIDIERGELLMIDHSNRSVLRADLAALPELTVEMIESFRSNEAGEMAAELEAMRAEGGGVSIDFTVTTHANARRERIGEFPADVHYVVVQADMHAPPTGAHSEGPTTLFLVNEIWETHAVPSEAAFFEEFGMNVAFDPRLMELASTTGGTSDPMAAFGILDAWSPGMGDAMFEMMEQAEQFTGTILRSVIAVSLTPFGTKVDIPDLERMIAMDPEASSALSVARSAARGALGGLMGRGRQAPSSPDPDPPYTPYLRMMSTRENLKYWVWEGDVLGQLMESIEGYQVQSLEELMRQVMPRS